MLFATLAVAATALLSWVSYRGVAAALDAEFVHRLENLAGTIASQVSAEDVEDARDQGELGTGYATLQVLLEEMRATSQLENAAVLDSARQVLYDCRGDLGPRGSSLDSLAGPGLDEALATALAGRPSVSPEYRRDGMTVRAGFAPITPGVLRADAAPTDLVRHPAGVVVVEAMVENDRVLAGLRRDFLLRTLIAALAMTVLAAVLLRIAWSSQRLERRLSRAENLAAMGQLTATLAHEIKNPLAIIRGSAERLGKLEPEAKRMADFVVEESDRLTRTVARYLTFANAGQGSSGPGHATGALEATLALLEGEFRQRHVELVREVTGEDTGTTLDNESLKQVYLNLILNALEAMSEGGTLTVTAVVKGAEVEVRIADTGPGIAREVLARLGEPFYTTREKGSGLGLFLTRRLVESAGGKLEIESAAGRGTTSVVRLPHRPGAAAKG